MHEFCSSKNICICVYSKVPCYGYIRNVISLTITKSSVQSIMGLIVNSRIQHSASSIRQNYILRTKVHVLLAKLFANRCFQLQLYLTTPKSTCGAVHHMRLCTPSNHHNFLYFPHKFIFPLFLVRHNLQRRRQHPNLCIQCRKDFRITVIILHAKTKDWLVEKTMDAHKILD